MRDAADKILSDIQDGKYEYDELDENELQGILTLENVVEFILKMDIKDEKDEDRQEIFKRSFRGSNRNELDAEG